MRWRLTQAERIAAILCRLSISRVIEVVEAQQIALRRSRQISAGRPGPLPHDQGRGRYWNGMFRRDKVPIYESLREEARAQRWQFVDLALHTELQRVKLWRSVFETEQTTRFINQLRKELKYVESERSEDRQYREAP